MFLSLQGAKADFDPSALRYLFVWFAPRTLPILLKW